MPRLRRALAAQPSVVKARRAARVAAYKVAWVIATVSLLGSTLIELTQAHPSRWTSLFPVLWLALTLMIVRAVRRIRKESV